MDELNAVVCELGETVGVIAKNVSFFYLSKVFVASVERQLSMFID